MVLGVEDSTEELQEDNTELHEEDTGTVNAVREKWLFLACPVMKRGTGSGWRVA